MLFSTKPILVPAWNADEPAFKVQDEIAIALEPGRRFLILVDNSGLNANGLELSKLISDQESFYVRMFGSNDDSFTAIEARQRIAEVREQKIVPGSFEQFLRFIALDEHLLLDVTLAFLGKSPQFENQVLFASGGVGFGSSGRLDLWPADEEFSSIVGPRNKARFFGVVDEKECV